MRNLGRVGVPVLFDWKEFSGASIFWFVFVAMDKNEQAQEWEKTQKIMKNRCLNNESILLRLTLRFS